MTDQPTPSAAAPDQKPSAAWLARVLLDFYGGDAERWTQGTSARTFDGALLDDGRDHGAVCWCISGADDVARDGMLPGSWGLFEAAIERLTGRVVVDFNDAPTTTFADVVAVLERIAAGEEVAS
jgi:hypothetical protein